MRAGFVVSIAAFVVFALLTAAGCSESSDSSQQVTSVRCTGGELAADVVTSTCGAALNSSTHQVVVALGGPTTSNDFHDFTFELLYDPLLLSYVEGSAVPGDLLTHDNRVATVKVTYRGGAGHLVVAVNRQDHDPGVAWSADANRVVTMNFHVASGSTFAPTTLHFENGQAFDSTGAAITSISYRDGAQLSYQ